MKQLKLRYAIVTHTIFFCLLLSATTNAQWSELGGRDKSTFIGYNNDWSFAGILTVATDVNGNVYTGGTLRNLNGNHNFVNYYVAKWDGNSWSELGDTNTTTFNGFINSITIDANGNVYAAGGFTNERGNYYVAKWSGTAWSELGGTNTSTFNQEIYSITTDANGNLYAGGDFANNNNNPYIAKWNGTVWDELGGTSDSIFKQPVYSIITDNKGNVYAGTGGLFTNDSSITTNYYYVAKWNGTVWSKLVGSNDATFNGAISSIATDTNGTIYAGGYFTNDNNNGDNYVAKWNDTAWVDLGDNFSSYITGVTADAKGNVYAVGAFTGILNGTSRSYVAKWDGTEWGELGGTNDSTFNNSIWFVTTDVKGNIYAGGAFSNDSGYQYVAKYTAVGLPIKLKSLSATQETQDIAINWQTATELNTSHFIIQHSANGTSFTDIATVKAIGSGANSYEFIDNNPANGINYYRLQSVDKDGAATDSKVVSVQFTVNSNQLTVYPNPSRDNVTISGNHIAFVQVIDNMGRVVKVVSLKDATNPTLSISSLPAGVYHLRIQTIDCNISSNQLIIYNGFVS